MAQKNYKDIFDAIRANDVEAVKAFLPGQLKAKDSFSWTPLHRACMWGRTEIVRLLLDSGADVNVYDMSNDLPLHYTCEKGYVEIARLLLDRGADIEAKDKYGRTALHWSCSYIKVVRLLLDYGINIDVQDNNGRTALHEACIYKYCKVSELLVRRGANPMVLDNHGQSAVYYDGKWGNNNSNSDNEVPHWQILIQLHSEYLNKQVLDKSERTAALSSGWEMEM